MNEHACPSCGEELPATGRPGRPSIYCSPQHRAEADAAVKRHERAVDILDRQITSHRAMLAGAVRRGRGCPGCPDPERHLVFLEAEAADRTRRIASLRVRGVGE